MFPIFLSAHIQAICLRFDLKRGIPYYYMTFQVISFYSEDLIAQVILAGYIHMDFQENLE